MTITFGAVRADIISTPAKGKENASEVSVRLHRGDVLRLRPSRRGVTVRSLRGELWLTKEGDPADYLLGAGESYQASGSGLVVAQAMDEATAEVSEGLSPGMPA